MEVHYGLLLKKSWNDLKNNLVIFLPIVFVVIMAIAFILLVVLEVFAFISAGFIVKDLTIGLLGASILIGFLDIILLILIAAIIGSMYLGLLNPIVNKKKAIVKDMWAGVNKFTAINFKVNMIKLSIFLLPLIILGLLTFLVFTLSKTAGIVLVVIFGILYFIYFIIAALVMVFGFLFLEPIISMDKIRSPIELMKMSLQYTRENLGHVGVTWIIIFFISSVIGGMVQLVSLPANIMPSLFLIFIPFIIIFYIVSMIVKAWLQIFLFNAYFNTKLKK